MANRITLFLWAFSIFSFTRSTAAISTQSKTASTVSQSSTGASWTNLANIDSKDGTTSTSSLSMGNTESKSILCSNFGFSIPSSASIEGISINIVRRASGLGTARDNQVQLLNMSGNADGDDKSSSSNWPTSLTETTYGGESDIWSLSLTPDYINDVDFGLIIRAESSALWPTAEIDYIEMIVTYDEISPLPVELVNFAALRMSFSTTELTWTTASEIDNDRFEIERSENGKNWKTIARVAGNGTSEQSHNYYFIDSQASNSITYYRLKQIDFNGSFEFSKTLSTLHKPKTIEQQITAYPNPTSHQINFKNLEGLCTISIWDMNGAIKFRQSMNKPQPIDVQQLNTGVYYVQIETASQVFKSAFIKQ